MSEEDTIEDLELREAIANAGPEGTVLDSYFVGALYINEDGEEVWSSAFPANASSTTLIGMIERSKYDLLAQCGDVLREEED